jgi:hypothetical protein
MFERNFRYEHKSYVLGLHAIRSFPEGIILGIGWENTPRTKIFEDNAMVCIGLLTIGPR